MPWFSVEDDFAYHPKAVAAGNAALGLWVRAGAWSMKYLTEGFVPADIVRTLGSAADVARLVNAGLWEAADGGYQFHEWGARQRSKKKVQSDREAGRRRIAKLRALADNVHNLDQGRA